MSAVLKLPKRLFESLKFFKTLKHIELIPTSEEGNQFIEVKCAYEPILICGKYLKFSRALA